MLINFLNKLFIFEFTITFRINLSIFMVSEPYYLHENHYFEIIIFTTSWVHHINEIHK